MRPYCLKVDYEVGPVEKEDVWEGVIVPNSQWVFPKKRSFQAQMRELYNHHEKHKKEAMKLKDWVKCEFSQMKMKNNLDLAIRETLEKKG